MSRQHDFTEGNILKQVIVFSGIIMLTNLLHTSYQVVDSLWIGNLLGAHALGAVTVSGAIIFTVLSFVIGLNNAALAILSQQKGRDDHDGMKRYLKAIVVILTVMAGVLSIYGFYFSEILINLLGTPDDMIAKTKTHIQININVDLILFGYHFISFV